MDRVTVFPDKFLPGWQGSLESETCALVRDGKPVALHRSPRLLEALETKYDTDAHFVPYSLKKRPDCPRLNKGVHVNEETGYIKILRDHVLFSVLVVDVDTPEHENATQAWVQSQISILDETPWGDTAGWYMTRGGYRVIWHLPKPLPPGPYIRTLLGLVSKLHAKGIEADRLKDWTRVYRLPYVLRDGQLQRYPLDLSWVEDGPIDVTDLAMSKEEAGSVFAGIGDVRGPLALRDDTLTTNRNVTLTRLAGGWRRTGMNQDEILGMLRTVNESRCDPPLPDSELETISRSIARYEPEAPVNKETDKDKGPSSSVGGLQGPNPGGSKFLLGSEAEIADHVCADLEGDGERMIHDRSILWRYTPNRGLWDEVPPGLVQRFVKTYDGEYVATGKEDRNTGLPTFTVLKVGATMMRNVHFIVTVERDVPQWLDEQAEGICFRDCFVRVDADGVHTEDFSPTHRQIAALPFKYVPGASPAAFLNLLREVWEDTEDLEEKIQLFREFVGAALTNRAPLYQKGMILVGGGANGKSTIQHIIKALFPFKTVTAVNPQDMDNEYRRAMLARSRLNVVSELPEADILSSEAVKAMIDGSLIVGRQIRQEPFEFQPKAAHLFSANSLPGVRDMTRGFWRRWLVLEFKREFAEEEQDRNLAGRIIGTELAEIACWALDGAAELAARGYYDIPASVAASVAKWRTDADAVALFVAEKLDQETDDGAQLPKIDWALSDDLYNVYVQWSNTSGHRQLTKIHFSKRLKLLGLDSTHTNKGTKWAARVSRPSLVTSPAPGATRRESGGVLDV